MKNNYWLYIEPYVHISIKGKNVLFYNTINNKRIEYFNNKKIYNLAKRLNSKNDSYVVKIRESDINDIEILDVINKMKKYFIGDIIESNYSTIKPFQLKPIINIQKGIKFLKSSPDFNVGRKMMVNLKELTLYINSVCSLNCSNCKKSFKQFEFCTKLENITKGLSIVQIKSIVDDLKGTSIQKINITGGNIFCHPEFMELKSMFLNYSHITEYSIHYKNLYANFDKIEAFDKNSSLNVLVDNEMDIEVLKTICIFLHKIEVKTIFKFIIVNLDDIKNVEEIISLLKIKDYIIHPYYDNSNISFFRRNIFINKMDIFDDKPTLADIFTRQTLNPLNFGKIQVTSDGNIFSNINNPKIGDIRKDTIYDSVYFEMENGNSWWKLRTNVQPCNKCIFNLLCPPISNYEMYMNKYDLCLLPKNILKQNKTIINSGYEIINTQ